MATRTYDQILAALDPSYSASRKLLQEKQNAIPGEVDAGIAQADAKLQVANTGILDAARRRGTGIALGGLPVAEQAKYAATEYAPAIARMKTEGANRATSLQEALLGYDREQRTQAQSIYDSELARDLQERQFAEQQRQFNEQLAETRRAAKASAGGGYGGIGGGKSGGSLSDLWNAGGQAQMAGKAGAFKFTDAQGRPISAYTYSQLTGTPYRSVLQQMAQAGDRTAKAGLAYFGNDGKWNNKLNAGGVTNQSIRQQLSSLNWR